MKKQAKFPIVIWVPESLRAESLAWAIQGCTRLCTCVRGFQKSKSPHYILLSPFQRLNIDLLGPYPRSKQGHVGLLIVLDHFSKFHWLHPLKKCISLAIQDFLLKHIFHCFGVPEKMIIDNGSQFKAVEFNSFLTELALLSFMFIQPSTPRRVMPQSVSNALY